MRRQDDAKRESEEQAKEVEEKTRLLAKAQKDEKKVEEHTKPALPEWQSALIDQILNSMHNFYCLPDKFEGNKNHLKNILINKCEELNETLLKGISDRVPDSEVTYTAFVNKINKSLHSFDTHLELAYNPKLIDEMKKGDKIKLSESSAVFDFSGGPPKEEVEKWNQYEDENPTFRNFGFIDYQGEDGVIPNNVGYVNISHLLDPQLGATETEEKYRLGPHAIKRLHEVMAKFRDKDAIILDLSVTPYGGSPEMVQNIVSFFMPERTPINIIHDRLSGKETVYEAIGTPFKILDKHVALLVGPKTFSGREEIAYDLQQLNTTLPESRFTVIGQPTKGGAHPECAFPLRNRTSEHINDSLILRIPYARSINPISRTNWEDQEKKGVQPEILIESKEALSAAVTHLKNRLSQTTTTTKTPVSAVSSSAVVAKKMSLPPSSLSAVSPPKLPEEKIRADRESSSSVPLPTSSSTLEHKSDPTPFSGPKRH